MSLRIAILGNSFARHAQLPALRWARENGAPHEVIALAGNDLEKARATAAEWGIPTVTDEWMSLFGSDVPPYDLVIVSTPTDLHAPMVRASLESGAAVLCEKPFAMDGGEARELTALARGKLALIDHQTRWSPWRRAFKAAIAEGIVGTPWAGRAQMRIASLPRLGAPMSWWYEAARGGGILGALGSHMLDGVMDQFGRRFQEVTARLTTVIEERSDAEGELVPVTADEEAWLHCVMDDGLPVTIETSIVAFGCERDPGRGNLLELRGSDGTLRLEGETDLVFIPHGEAAYELSVEPLPTCDDYGMGSSGMFPRCLPTYLRDVLVAVAARKTELTGAATFASAVHVMDVMDAARISHREGRRIAVERTRLD